jgi:Domain of unknown function (DUF3943)
LKKVIVCLILFLPTGFAAPEYAAAEDCPACALSPGDPDNPHGPEQMSVPVDPPDDEKPAKDTDLRPANFRTYMYDTWIWYGVQWAGRLWWVRDKNLKIFDASFSTFWDNLTREPLWNDQDDFIVNWVLHPFFGMLSYQFYRARGHSFWASALGSVIQSTLFEYAIEGWVVRPSGVDLIVTPALGVPLGWTMEQLSDWLIDQDNKAAHVAAYIADPMRLFVKNRNLGLINPMTGAFEFHGPFTISTTKGRALALGYTPFFEPPLPLGRIGIDLEVINLRHSGGQYILYPMRLEFPSESNYVGVYLDLPYGGVNHVKDGDTAIRDGFEFGNLGIGVKGLAIKSHDYAVAAGIEALFPTSLTDSQDRLQQVVKYRRDFSLYLYQAFTASPYVTGGVWKGPFSLQGSFGSDFIFHANHYEGQDFEFRINYHAAAGVNVPMTGSPTVYCEFDGYTVTSQESPGNTNLFLTPGIRFGNKYSPGFAVQFPVDGPTKDLADVDFITDFQLRF